MGVLQQIHGECRLEHSRPDVSRPALADAAAVLHTYIRHARTVDGNFNSRNTGCGNYTVTPLSGILSCPDSGLNDSPDVLCSCITDNNINIFFISEKCQHFCLVSLI